MNRIEGSNNKPIVEDIRIKDSAPIKPVSNTDNKTNSTIKKSNNGSKVLTTKQKNLASFAKDSAQLTIISLIYNWQLGEELDFNGCLKELAAFKSSTKGTWPVISQHLTNRRLANIAKKKEKLGLSINEPLPVFTRLFGTLSHYKDYAFCAFLNFSLKSVADHYIKYFLNNLSNGIESFIKKNYDSPTDPKKTIPYQLTKEFNDLFDIILSGMHDYANHGKNPDGQLIGHNLNEYIKVQLNKEGSEKKLHKFVQYILNKHLRFFPILGTWREGTNPLLKAISWILYIPEKIISLPLKWFLNRHIPSQVEMMKENGIASMETTGFELAITNTLIALLENAQTSVKENKNKIKASEDLTDPIVEDQLKSLAPKIVKVLQRSPHQDDRDKLKRHIENENNPISLKNPVLKTQQAVDNAIEDLIIMGGKTLFDQYRDPKNIEFTIEALVESLNNLYQADFIENDSLQRKEYQEKTAELENLTSDILDEVLEDFAIEYTCGLEEATLINQELAALNGNKENKITGLKQEAKEATRSLEAKLDSFSALFKNKASSTAQQVEVNTTWKNLDLSIRNYNALLDKWENPTQETVGFVIDPQVAKELKKKIDLIRPDLEALKAIEIKKQEIKNDQVIKDRFLALKNLLLTVKKNSSAYLSIYNKEKMLNHIRSLQTRDTLKTDKSLEFLKQALESGNFLNISIIDKSLDKAIDKSDQALEANIKEQSSLIQALSDSIKKSQEKLSKLEVSSYQKGSRITTGLTSTVGTGVSLGLGGVLYYMALANPPVAAATAIAGAGFSYLSTKVPFIHNKAIGVTGFIIKGLTKRAREHLVSPFIDHRVKEAFKLAKQPYVYHDGLMQAAVHLQENLST